MIKIFVVEDDPIFGGLIKTRLEKNELYDVSLFTNGPDFLQHLPENPDLIVLDYHLPDTTGLELLKKIKAYNANIATIILSGQQTAEVVVEAYNNGANRYLLKNSNALVELENAIKGLSENINLRQEVEQLREKIIDRSKYENIIGESPAIMKSIRLLQKVENTNILTLITGESGTGKEVFAQAIHYNSPRKKKPFIAVNMAAIPEDLIESELFGHEKGAFTGATGRRIGKFEESDGGTIFLDEIGEMDINLQTKLLRVLQENKISRIGSNKEVPIDLRVVAATNKNLGERVKEGKFREDLYYRLQGFLIHLPPLRERDNDVILLAKHFLKLFCEKNNMPVKKLATSGIELLLKHTWPGNIRELKAAIERAVLISDNDTITEDDIVLPDMV